LASNFTKVVVQPNSFFTALVMTLPLIPNASIATICLAVVVLAAVVFDLRWRRVPNKLVLLGMVLAMLLHMLALSQGTRPLAGESVWSALAGLAVGLALMLPLYLIRAMGAGDVKLMAMVGAFVGTTAVVNAAVYTLLAGGLLALIFMFSRGVAAQTFSNLRYLLTDWMVRVGSSQGAEFAPLVKTAARLPYAVAIASGTAASLLWPLFQA
jgi:prepilin peptidase CpaA